MKNILLFIATFMLSPGGKAQYSTGLNHIDYAELVKENVEEEYFSHSGSLPVDVSTIEVESGLFLEYAEQGNRSGKPLIFIHGLTDSWRSFEKILKRLPEDYPYHAIAITLRGHGGSAKPESGYTIDRFAKDISSFIRKKGLGKSVLIGHSLGGLVAQRIAIDYPELTKGLVILSSDANFKNNPGLEDFQKEVNSLSSMDRSYLESFQKSTLHKPIDQSYFDTLVSESLKTALHVFKSAINGVLESNLEQELTKLKLPVLILWGEHDLICPEEGQLTMRRLIAGAKLIRYENTGHALHWEDPDRFLEDLTKFIDQLK